MCTRLRSRRASGCRPGLNCVGVAYWRKRGCPFRCSWRDRNVLQIWMIDNFCAAIPVLGQWQSKPQNGVRAMAEARVEAARRGGFGRGGEFVLVWSQAVAINPESGGWCGAQTCQAASWLHATWRLHCLCWGGWTVGFPLPGGVVLSGFCAVGTGDRALVTVPWAMVVGLPVHCQVVFAGL